MESLESDPGGGLQHDWAGRRRGVGPRHPADGIPTSITVDHGTEFTSHALDEWAYRRGVKLDFTCPGKPAQNGHIESFNGRLRGRSTGDGKFKLRGVKTRR
jgi:transposase InsO family protein